MTAFTTLLNALFLPGKRILGATGMALRDNLLSAFEGDATAVTAGVTLRLQALQRLVAGDSVRIRQDASVQTSVSTFETVVSNGISDFSFVQSGTLRVTFEHRRISAGTHEIRLRRRRAGTLSTINTWSTTSATLQAVSEDITVVAGDLYFFEQRNITGGATAEVVNRRFSVAAGISLFPICAFGFIEGNP